MASIVYQKHQPTEPKQHLVHTEEDSKRPPQLDEAVSKCRCGCACSQGRGKTDQELDMISAVSEFNGEGMMYVGPTTNTDVYEDEDDISVRGEQGAGNHQVEIGDLGTMTAAGIAGVIARIARNRCDCDRAQQKLLQQLSPTRTHMSSPSSTTVELSSTEHSVASSGFLPSPVAGPEVFDHMGGQFEGYAYSPNSHGLSGNNEGSHGRGSSLCLNHERSSLRTMEPTTGFAEYDIW